MSTKINLYFLVFLQLLFSCDNAEVDQNTDDITSLSTDYKKQGCNYLGRIDSYNTNTFGSYYITVLDLREVNGKLLTTWWIRENFNLTDWSYNVYFGELKNSKFIKADYVPCGNPATNSDFDKRIQYEVDAQGELFTTYIWRDNDSGMLTWTHQFCCSSGLASLDEYVDYPMVIRENNQLVSAVGGGIYNGLEIQQIKFFSFLNNKWRAESIPNLNASIQAIDYHVTEKGNSFIAYSNYTNNEFNGNINLLGFDGVNWYNFGMLPIENIRKQDGYNLQPIFKPFPIKIVRNGEKPFIVMPRENNTIAVMQFDGTSLKLVADNVELANREVIDFTRIQIADFCVYQNELLTFGKANELGKNNKQTIYKLEGNQFVEFKKIEGFNLNIQGVYSNNEKLWAACEIWRANDGLFTSPVDIIEIE